MPRAPIGRGRIRLRLRPQDISATERATLSERDSLRVLDLLEHPPAAPERLRRAARAGAREGLGRHR